MSFSVTYLELLVLFFLGSLSLILWIGKSPYAARLLQFTAAWIVAAGLTPEDLFSTVLVFLALEIALLAGEWFATGRNLDRNATESR